MNEYFEKEIAPVQRPTYSPIFFTEHQLRLTQAGYANTALSFREKGLFALIVTYSDPTNKNWCFLSAEEIAERIKMSRTFVYSTLQSLEKKGAIQSVPFRKLLKSPKHPDTFNHIKVYRAILGEKATDVEGWL